MTRTPITRSTCSGVAGARWPWRTSGTVLVLGVALLGLSRTPSLGQSPLQLQVSDPGSFQEPLPTPADPPSAYSPPPITTGSAAGCPKNAGEARQRVLSAVQADLETVEESAARELSRLKQSLQELDSGFRLQEQRRQAMQAALRAARRQAEEAEEAAARERKRFETLLQEAPWNRSTPTQEIPADLQSGTEATRPPAPDATHEVPMPSFEHGPTTGGPTTGTPDTPRDVESAPQAVAGTAVDRPRLADSLYGSGQYDLAVRLYMDLAHAAPDKKDESWYFFQIAGCYRHLGDPAQAAKFYRVVAGMPEAEGLAEYAKWWLSNMEEQSRLKQGLEQLRQSLHGSDPRTR